MLHLNSFCYCLLFSMLLLSPSLAEGQDTYWVYFEDKGNTAQLDPASFLSPDALSRRAAAGIKADFSDLPVADQYLQQLRQIPALEIRVVSKWLNAVSVRTQNQTAIAEVSAFPFVRSVEAARKYRADAPEPLTQDRTAEGIVYGGYGPTAGQLEITNTDYLHKLGFRGAGIRIGVFDGGFVGVDQAEGFSEMWENNRIVDYWNFGENDDSVFRSSSHGTSVLSIIGSNIPGVYVGAAPEAEFCLYRTEIVEFERVIEEDLWLAAAERADMMGVHIINTSLGYTLFDAEDSLSNHSYEDMDGNTTVISKAADMAASKGILVVVSAGNQGDDPWFYISAPSDGDSVLAVGAVDINGVIAPFSGHGPSSDGDIKPNVASVGRATYRLGADGTVSQGSGTSFSAPLVAGAAACLWQGRPEWSNMEVFRAIEASADRYNNPDTRTGYGIPDMAAAYYRNAPEELGAPGEQFNVSIFPNPMRNLGGIMISGLPANESAMIEITDISGRMLLESPVNSGLSGSFFLPFDGVNQLSTGQYQLTVRVGELVQTKKLLVQ